MMGWTAPNGIISAKLVVLIRSSKGGPSMTKVSMIGLDLAKNVFQVHGIDATGKVVVRRQLRRRQLEKFLAALPPGVVVGMEACSGAHHWGRVIEKLGHEARMMPAAYVKPYVKRNKNDGRDAEGLCEAASRPRMRYVPVKTAEQQAALMLAGTRDGLIRRRTQLTNTIRGYAAEFGLTAAKGLDKIEPLLARIATAEDLPELAKELFATYAQQYAQLKEQVRTIETRLMAWHRRNEASRRLAEIPAVGPIGGALAVMKVADPQAFRSGRDFAAWIGLTPKDHSTAGRTRLGVITHAGDEALRSVLVAGATAVIQQARKGRGRHSRWLLDLIARKPPKLAAVALANKNARIIWKLLVSGQRYNPARAMRDAAAGEARGAALRRASRRAPRLPASQAEATEMTGM